MTSRTRLALVPALALCFAQGCADPSAPPTGPGPSNPVTSLATACKAPPSDDLINLPIAPRAKRVDMAVPRFSRPTEVSNPLFPIKSLHHAVLVGLSDGEVFRAETTLLPSTKRLSYEGGEVEALVSQYVAFLGGRIHEVALDWYAQADDGAVWYLGEDVTNYEDGAILDHNGTWISCIDGPPAMIMPGTPRVGDVFRVENVFPLVFEEVDVTHVNQTVPGPLGPVSGAIVVRQLHLDGSYAPKTFAPGYGEFSTGSGDNIESLAVAVPIDRASGKTPAALDDLLDAAEDGYQAATAGKWSAANKLVARAESGWGRYRASAPTLLAPLVADAVEAFAAAVVARDAERARQTALDLERTSLDLLVRHAPIVEVDVERLETFARQLALDADGEDAGGARGSLVAMGLILDRLPVTGERKRGQRVAEARRIIADLTSAVDRGEFGRVASGAGRLAKVIDE